MQGQLFSHDFLTRGILDTAPWHAFDQSRLDVFSTELHRVYGVLAADTALNEAQTESELIEPVLALLGWEHLPQINLSESGREDVPDFLLFADTAAKSRALSEAADDRRARHGICLVEAKRWLRVLDRNESQPGATRKPRDFGAPSSQMLRYLWRADVMSDRAVKWGILTNGAVWRLYWQDARSRAEDFFEIDFAAAARRRRRATADSTSYEPAHGLKLFFLFFNRAAFLTQTWDARIRSFHAYRAQRSAASTKRRCRRTSAQRVFDEIFPRLAQALADRRPAGAQAEVGYGQFTRQRYTRDYLDEVREAALILLYRLLFLFYAEDRAPAARARPALPRLQRARAARATCATRSTAATSFSTTARQLLARPARRFPAHRRRRRRRRHAGLQRRPVRPRPRAAARAHARARRRAGADHRRAVAPHRRPAARAGSTTATCRSRTSAASTNACSNTACARGAGRDDYHDKPEIDRIVARPASFARKVSGSYYTHDDLVRLDPA